MDDARKPIRQMSLEEYQEWLLSHQAELEDFCSFAQRYVKRRAGDNQRRTRTDERYDRFLLKAGDLISGLEELRDLPKPNNQERGEP